MYDQITEAGINADLNNMYFVKGGVSIPVGEIRSYRNDRFYYIFCEARHNEGFIRIKCTLQTRHKEAFIRITCTLQARHNRAFIRIKCILQTRHKEAFIRIK